MPDFPRELLNIPNRPIHIYNCGTQDCPPFHSYGPAVRDHYLIHCILRGRGKYCIGDKTYRLHAGQAFMIFPGALTVYQADEKEPWSYVWVGFNGQDAAYILDVLEMDVNHPILTFDDGDALYQLVDALARKDMHNESRLSSIADLYGFLSRLRPEQRQAVPEARSMTSLALEYLNRNFSYGVTIEDLAAHIGISRSQLFRVFHKELGISPQECLIQIRLHNADKLLSSTDLSVAEVMYSCGYQNMSNFSKQFKKQFAQSPRQRKRMYQDSGPNNPQAQR